MYTPVVYESAEGGEREYDVFSRLMKDRVIFIGGEIDLHVANCVVAQMVFLDNLDHKTPITLYINSPGGCVNSMWAMYDTMQYVKAPVHTLCIGMACSAAAVLLASGEPGGRRSLPHTEIMVHQPSGGSGGKLSEMKRWMGAFEKQEEEMNRVLSKHTGLPKTKIKELLEWDTYMTPVEAKEYGLIDEIIKKRR